ncbi:MAG: hypothetical protein O7G88_09760, partial [bacterium]|nr:hypothetical protein [bacterium]
MISYVMPYVLIVMITACSGKVSHQPTFSDIEPDVNPLAKRTACNEEKAEALVETQQLTDHELEIIRATGQPRLIAGAAMQVPRGDDSGTALLRRALALDPAIELLHIALIDRHFAKLFNEPIDSREEEALRGAIERFRHKAADNAFAQYLWAWQLLHDGRVSESIEALGAGNATSRFT